MIQKGSWRSVAKLVWRWHLIIKVLKLEVIEGPYNLSNGQICQRLHLSWSKKLVEGHLQKLVCRWHSITRSTYKTYPHVISQKLTPPLPLHIYIPPPPQWWTLRIYVPMYTTFPNPASSLTLPWVIRGSTGYFGLNLGHLCLIRVHP